MLKTFGAIGLAASIGFAPMLLAPMAAKAAPNWTNKKCRACHPGFPSLKTQL